MKGYVATFNGTYKYGIKIEIGKTYTYDGIPNDGFKVFSSLDYIFEGGYSYDRLLSKIFEVEMIDFITLSGYNNKCNQMTIVREVPFDEYSKKTTNFKFDENKNLIYAKYANGVCTTYTYGENSRLLYEESDNSTWIKYEYDDNGRQTSLIHSNPNYNRSFKYDERGNLARIDYPDGSWSIFVNDESGKTQQYMSSFSSARKYEYNNNMLSRIDVCGENYAVDYSIEYEYEYDENGVMRRKVVKNPHDGDEEYIYGDKELACNMKDDKHWSIKISSGNTNK